jgi:hypothetical protein
MVKAFRKLARLRRKTTRLPDRAKHQAAYSVRALFHHFNLPFRDYDDADHQGRGAAAWVLRIVLGGGAPANLRHLIRSALKSPR